MHRIFLLITFAFAISLTALSPARARLDSSCIGLSEPTECCDQHNLPFYVCFVGSCSAQILYSGDVQVTEIATTGWQPFTSFPVGITTCLYVHKKCNGLVGCYDYRQEELECETTLPPANEATDPPTPIPENCGH